MRERTNETEREKQLQAIWWELALAWRLYDAAVRERRFADAECHARQRELVESRARILLNMAPGRS